VFFPTAFAYLPTLWSIAERKLTDKEGRSEPLYQWHPFLSEGSQGKEKQAGHTLLRTALIGSVPGGKWLHNADNVLYFVRVSHELRNEM
jgi:hypothetical protein